MLFHLSGIQYGDLTGDGDEEAVLFLGVSTRGSAIPGLVYVYSVRQGRPKMLWAFWTGDRADGGYKNVYVDLDGELVVELRGKNKYIGGNLYAEDETARGACCPTMYTRARYKWNGAKFALEGKPESFPLNP
jgi:hypothetical protein